MYIICGMCVFVHVYIYWRHWTYSWMINFSLTGKYSKCYRRESEGSYAWGCWEGSRTIKKLTPKAILYKITTMVWSYVEQSSQYMLIVAHTWYIMRNWTENYHTEYLLLRHRDAAPLPNKFLLSGSTEMNFLHDMDRHFNYITFSEMAKDYLFSYMFCV